MHMLTTVLFAAGYKKDVEMKRFLAQQKVDYKATKGLFKVVGCYIMLCCYTYMC